MVSARVAQFPFTAIPVEHAYGGHAVVSRTNHVMAPVADHDGLRRVDSRRLKGVTQEVGLVGILAVQFRTKHAFKIDPQFEVIDDALRIDAWLARGNEQAAARPGQRRANRQTH